MKRFNSKRGFTLLEIIIVIIILGVLASLALPRMFAMTTNSQAVEAINSFKTIRNGMDMCFMQNAENYVGCNSSNWNNLGVNDPAAEPGAHFASYTIVDTDFDTYSIIATHADAATDFIVMTMDRPANPAVVIRGAGAFTSINVTSNT